MNTALLVTGDRNWLTDIQHINVVGGVLEQMKSRGVTVIIAGNAKGLDRQCEELAYKMGFTVRSMPPDWKRYGRAAGPIRNKEMLMELLTYDNRYVCAFHDSFGSSKGTKNMVIQATKAGVNVNLYNMDGFVECIK